MDERKRLANEHDRQARAVEGIKTELEEILDPNVIARSIREGLKFRRYAQVNAFTSENLSGYFPKLDFKDKRVLTVGSSGDHIINSYLQGATHVTAFDINLIALFYSDLKLNAKRRLDFKDFKKFLLREDYKGKDNKEVMKFDVYKEIKEDLADLTQYFFDRAYHVFDNDGYEVRKSHMFNNFDGGNKPKIRCNPYLKNKAAYDKKTPIARWEASAIRNLDKHFNPQNRFEIIILSNVANYAEEIFGQKEGCLDSYVEEVIKPLTNHLQPGGTMCAAYLRDVKGNFEDTEMDNTGLRKKLLDKLDMDYTEITFPGVRPHTKDGQVILKKRKE